MAEYVEQYAREPRDRFTISEAGDFVRVVARPSRRPRLSLSLGVLRTVLCEIFLPRGYPHSVSGDYLSYQIWDTVQAFASSMTAALAMEAVLRGAGVGNQNATALAATLAWILKDGLGMITRICFAWLRSAQLDADCKQWRLAADALNDVAFSLDLVAPAFPHLFTLIVCLSSCCRSIVGVAGGATRTVVVQHQARSNNLADVAAKDGSQETLVNVSALICSLALLPLVSGKPTLVWFFYFLFTFIHLAANYRVVAVLQFESINRRLLAILTREFVKNGRICGVAEANAEESLLLPSPGVRRYGCRLSETINSAHKLMYTEANFVCSFDPARNIGRVSVATNSEAEDHLRAAFYIEFAHETGRLPDTDEWEEFLAGLLKAGWRTQEHRLAFEQWTYLVK